MCTVAQRWRKKRVEYSTIYRHIWFFNEEFFIASVHQQSVSKVYNARKYIKNQNGNLISKSISVKITRQPLSEFFVEWILNSVLPKQGTALCDYTNMWQNRSSDKPYETKDYPLWNRTRSVNSSHDNQVITTQESTVSVHKSPHRQIRERANKCVKCAVNSRSELRRERQMHLLRDPAWFTLRVERCRRWHVLRSEHYHDAGPPALSNHSIEKEKEPTVWKI